MVFVLNVPVSSARLRTPAGSAAGVLVLVLVFLRYECLIQLLSWPAESACLTFDLCVSSSAVEVTLGNRWAVGIAVALSASECSAAETYRSLQAQRNEWSSAVRTTSHTKNPDCRPISHILLRYNLPVLSLYFACQQNVHKVSKVGVVVVLKHGLSLLWMMEGKQSHTQVPTFWICSTVSWH